MKIKNIFLTLTILIQFGFSQEHYYYKNDKKILLEPYTSQIQNTTKVDYYKNQKGTIVGVTDSIIIKVSDESKIGLYAYEYNLSIEKKLSETLYLLKTSDKSKTLKTVNSLRQKDGVVYAHPDFIKKQLSR